MNRILKWFGLSTIALIHASVVVCCSNSGVSVDIHAKSHSTALGQDLSDFLAAKINQPYINGGVKNFVAEYREFATTNLVERYGPKVAQDRKVFSCQEDGEVPMTSIVLTNAYAGAFQAIAALQRLSGRQRSTIESTYWNAHSNEVYVTESTATAV